MSKFWWSDVYLIGLGIFVGLPMVGSLIAGRTFSIWQWFLALIVYTVLFFLVKKVLR